MLAVTVAAEDRRLRTCKGVAGLMPPLVAEESPLPVGPVEEPELRRRRCPGPCPVLVVRVASGDVRPERPVEVRRSRPGEGAVDEEGTGGSRVVETSALADCISEVVAARCDCKVAMRKWSWVRRACRCVKVAEIYTWRHVSWLCSTYCK